MTGTIADVVAPAVVDRLIAGAVVVVRGDRGAGGEADHAGGGERTPAVTVMVTRPPGGRKPARRRKRRKRASGPPWFRRPTSSSKRSLSWLQGSMRPVEAAVVALRLELTGRRRAALAARRLSSSAGNENVIGRRRPSASPVAADRAAGRTAPPAMAMGVTRPGQIGDRRRRRPRRPRRRPARRRPNARRRRRPTRRRRRRAGAIGLPFGHAATADRQRDERSTRSSLFIGDPPAGLEGRNAAKNSRRATARIAASQTTETPGASLRTRPAFKSSNVEPQAASSTAASSPSAASALAARRCERLRWLSISFSASISTSFCTAAISRMIRSSAAS